MSKQERLREALSGSLDVEYLRQRESAGWRLAAVEWVRDTGETGQTAPQEEVPYGLRVGPDCIHLEEDTTEKKAMMLILEMLIQDIRLPQVAVEHGWSADVFLSQGCVKAGLPPDAWKHGATLWRFEAEVFGESGSDEAA